MNAFAPVFDNPGLLKLELMLSGVRVSGEDVRGHDVDGVVTGHALFGSSGDIDLLLPGGTWASVPLIRGLVRDTPFILTQRAGRDVVSVKDAPDLSVAVEIRPPARVFDFKTKRGIPFGQFGTVHGPYMAVSPTNHCTFIDDDQRCGFCGVTPEGGARPPVDVDDIIEAIHRARDEHPVHIVYLSVGHLGTEDGGVAFIEPYIAGIKKHFDVLVAVDALPPQSNRWIDRTYAMGADAISYNLEIFDPKLFEQICPGPAQTIGRGRFLEALEYAATVFPSGGTACHLIVGMEDIASTRAGIDRLTDMGVLPVLPLYRPFKGRDMRHGAATVRNELNRATLSELNRHLYEAVQRAGISLHMVRDIAIVTTPLEARFFAETSSLWSNLSYRMMGSWWGRRTTAHLSDLRRALRVRHVPESA